MSKALTRAIDSVAEAVLRSCGSNAAAAAAAAAGGQQQQQLQAAPGLLGQPLQRQQQLASETTQEGLAAAALVDVMLQVCEALLVWLWISLASVPGVHAAADAKQTLTFVWAAILSQATPRPYLSLGFAAAAAGAAVPQLYPADVPTLLLPCFMAMAQLVGNEALPLPRQVTHRDLVVSRLHAFGVQEWAVTMLRTFWGAVDWSCCCCHVRRVCRSRC
jgi:hypothetical protein